MEKPVLLSLSQCFRLQNVSHSQRQFSRTLSLAKLVMHLEPRKVALNFKCFFFLCGTKMREPLKWCSFLWQVVDLLVQTSPKNSK